MLMFDQDVHGMLLATLSSPRSQVQSLAKIPTSKNSRWWNVQGGLNKNTNKSASLGMARWMNFLLWVKKGWRVYCVK